MRKLNYKYWGILVILFSITTISWSNNLKVENVILTRQNVAEQFTVVQFDLSWENSWRTNLEPNNWDAAWVFIKFRRPGRGWKHATLNYVDGTAAADGHEVGPEATISTPMDGKGAFIYRAQNGSGTNQWKIGLRWNYGEDTVGNQASVEVRVYAIEMVYVPEGPFRVGGRAGSEVGKIFQWQTPLDFNTPYVIGSEQAITVAAAPNNLYYFSPTNWDAGDQMGPIPNEFPKGFAAFYCMKYEVTQEQWLDFFNTLPPHQQTNNDITDLDHRGPNPIDRNTIEWEGTGGAYTTHPNVPLSFPLWGEIMAYMDWSGLRPMTELEFVKACRGPKNVVPEGYAWGSANIIPTNFTYDLLYKGEDDEQLVNSVANTGNANWINSAIFEDGPYRSGIFASSLTTDRERSGASYYGIMEMSGNLSEMAVTIGTPEGRAFKGNHGDGQLSPNGEANELSWPPITGEGGGLFGGSWFSLAEQLWINDRRSATNGNVGYFNDVGFRCVRSAP